jgi:hypothetical protein
MTKTPSAIAVFACALLLCAAGSASAQDGSIEKSWGKSSSEKKAEPMQRATPAPAPQQRGDKDSYPTWDKTRQSDIKPWRQQNAAPQQQYQQQQQSAAPARGYYAQNKMMIDSLTNLFCLSSSYIRSLTNRNEVGRTFEAPAPKSTDAKQGDFQYRGDAVETKKPQLADPLAALNTELQRLLEQCLYGR